MRLLSIGLLSLVVSGCVPPRSDEPLFRMDGQDLLVSVGGEGRTARVRHLPATDGASLYLEDDSALVVDDDGISISDLQVIAHKAPKDRRYHDLLVRIFNEYGVSMSYLPRGYSAGLGASIDLSERMDASDALEHLTGVLWYGKYFESPEQCARITRGANRVGGGLRIDFVARLVPRDLVHNYVENPEALDVHARSNYVDLNYKVTRSGSRRASLAEPNTHADDDMPGLRKLAGVVERLGVYDLGVMIPGRNGPILVGRTWLGSYADNKEQTYSASSLDGKQIAWFFLDFSRAAIEAQETPMLIRVGYTPKTPCARRAVSTEIPDLPDPRSLQSESSTSGNQVTTSISQEINR